MVNQKTFAFLSFILSNVNYSVGFVDYERFKLEREEAQIIDAMSDEQRQRYLEQKDAVDKKHNKNNNHSESFFNDLLWMLEYNQNGFMQLIICVIHLYLLISQVVACFLYLLFSSEQDPITGEFINPVLRYAEYLFIYDYIHIFDINGRYNLLTGWTFLQILILRLRAFFSRFQQAKHNRFKYQNLNIVEFGMAFVNEFQVPHSKCIKNLIDNPIYHNCAEITSLTGESRGKIIKFNKKIQCLSRIDRVYYYNQINFTNCYKGINFPSFVEFKEKKRQIDCEISDEIFAMNLSKFHTNSRLERQKNITFFRYLFSINLPKKISYVPEPETRLHIIPEGEILYVSYLFGNIWMIFIWTVLCSLINFVCIEYGVWRSYSLVGKVFAALKADLTIALLIVNIADMTLLFVSALLLSGRSQKIVYLLKNEIEFYNRHLKRVSDIYFEEQCKESIRSKFTNILSFSTGFKKRFNESDQLEESQLRNRLHNFSFLREKVDETIINQIYDDYDDDQHIRLYRLISDYRESLSEKKILEFNENISYLLDLVEVIQAELNDNKRFFTTVLDINVIFGTIGCSITVSIFLSSRDFVSILFATLGAVSSFLIVILLLTLGALGGASFIKLYRHLRPLLANQLGFIEAKNHDRLFKICENLVEIENRSFLILGNFPLNFGSLTSIIIWITTCTYLLLRFIL